jgi:hypothetical protein
MGGQNGGSQWQWWALRSVLQISFFRRLACGAVAVEKVEILVQHRRTQMNPVDRQQSARLGRNWDRHHNGYRSLTRCQVQPVVEPVPFFSIDRRSTKIRVIYSAANNPPSM